MSFDPPVAIVGMGGIFPGAATPEAFWDILIARRNMAREVPEGRWTLPASEAYDPRIAVPDKVYSTRGCFLDGMPPDWDPGKLDLDVELLEELDPLFHVLLYAGEQAYSSAKTGELDPSRVGVIAGNIALPSEKASGLARAYLGRTFEEKALGFAHLDEPPPHPLNRFHTGLPAAVLAKALGLGGGAFTLDAACASSLYALKLATDALQSGRADAMLAGGMSRPDALYTQMGFSQLRALSPSGICAPFDAKGDGLVVGEGAGMFVLKRLDDALEHGDTILGVIRGIGLSNDIEGNVLAPSSEGQLRAMRAAYEQAAWEPADVNMVECHATGTPVGDAVEFASLRALWPDSGWTPGQCAIGAVKSNIGHLLTGAGAASLYKVLLSLQHRTLPPTANFTTPNERLELADSPFSILTSARPWDQRDAQHPRRAAVSAFGFGGINAHVLVEEFDASPHERRPASSTPVTIERSSSYDAPVAIVGMDAQFSGMETLRAFQEQVLSGDGSPPTTSEHPWREVEKAAWFRREGYHKVHFGGHYLDEFDFPLTRFHIPPRELEEMLPQQLLMLKTAGRALDDTRIDEEANLRGGVFIGISMDMNTTNFTLRWWLRTRARAWAEARGWDLDEQAHEQWLAELCNAASPPLNANRTMGALGSIVASRIARAFRFGGPSFTVSSEDTSGMHALQTAIEAIRRGEVSHALVGAVDFAGDVRAALARQGANAYARNGGGRSDGEHLAGEGAAALVLKPLDKAERDGDRIYAVLRGVELASETGSAFPKAGAGSISQSLRRTLGETRISPHEFGYIELQGTEEASGLEALTPSLTPSSETDHSIALGNAQDVIGHTGAASGLVSVIKAASSLYQEIIPGAILQEGQAGQAEIPEPLYAPPEPYYWMRNRCDGPRRALVQAGGIGGNAGHAVLEAYEAPNQNTRIEAERRQPLGARSEALFPIEASHAEDLRQGLIQLERLVRKAAVQPLETLARSWHTHQSLKQAHTHCLALVPRSSSELLEQIAWAQGHLADGSYEALKRGISDAVNPAIRDRVFFRAHPPGKDARVAFVFPGSGNQFAGMGRTLSVEWPEIFRVQDAENERLRSQFQPEWFWQGRPEQPLEQDHQALIFGQVALGTAVSDLARQFGLEPDAVVGYSLGETAGLFALRAWRDRDLMLERVRSSTLFTRDLAGECKAARRAWRLPKHEAVDWVLGVIDRPVTAVKQALRYVPAEELVRDKVYPLIANTFQESVIGGNRKAVENLIHKLQCQFIPLNGVTTVHCEVVKEVEEEYRNLHLFDTTPPPGVAFYSGAWGKAYALTRDSAAGSILAQAMYGVDFPKVVNAAYDDGLRVFIEMGPGNSCTRMIGRILGDRPHMACSMCHAGADGVSSVLRSLGRLLAERVPVELGPLYGAATRVSGHSVQAASKEKFITVRPALPPFHLPTPKLLEPARDELGSLNPDVAQFDVSVELGEFEPQDPSKDFEPVLSESHPAAEVWALPEPSTGFSNTLPGGFQTAATATGAAHAAYLALSREVNTAMSKSMAFQMQLIQHASESEMESAATTTADWEPPQMELRPSPPETKPAHSGSPVFLDREQCLEFARGRIGRVLGPEFAAIDAHPTRVRLPDEPLMLVDRIIAVEGEPRSLSSGRVVTEHDVLQGGWYLDNGRIPACIAIESGQADLFLSAWLGIDFETQGLAIYRLLDATVTFHGPLPKSGEVIRYDIRIERFFKHGKTYLFRFQFDGTVNGRPVLSMREGCAGFFTPEELAAGRGLVAKDLEIINEGSDPPKDWRDLAPMARESYSERQIEALRQGNPARCFGEAFARLPLADPMRLPGGRMRLVDRVTDLDPNGGRHGLGFIRAEADIHPDDWFLTCHFVDDQVMPGTLMYECCLHTFRIFLMRMGWIGEHADVTCEPVPGIAAKLKCRGQVIASTRTVAYEVSLQEFGYRPEPYAIASALMYADSKPIVVIEGMSIRLNGLKRDTLEAMWARVHGNELPPGGKKPAVYDYERILAFSEGKPSEAYGDRYKPFDAERTMARLPRPPYLFMHRVTEVTGEPWVLKAGDTAEAQYDVPEDAWYFQSGRQAAMPYSVLLECGLQPCGWLAAYMGSALTSDQMLHFRNLGGTGVQKRLVTPESGTLTTQVKCTNIARSGPMLIQHYDMRISDQVGCVYEGKTYFGFFTSNDLANQVGIRDAKLYAPDAAEQARAIAAPVPDAPPFPLGESGELPKLAMIDEIACFIADGGPHGLGYIRGTKQVHPDEWFFRAHFYQDPVWPGSLGLEAFVQLLQYAAAARWNLSETARFESLALDTSHEWIYRGQVAPQACEVTVDAVVTHVDDTQRLIQAEGYLFVHDRPIYHMKDFAIRVQTT